MPTHDDRATTLASDALPAPAPRRADPLAETFAAPSASDAPVDPSATRLELGTGERYEFRRAIGEGGMGEVQLHRDVRVGRHVALKRLRAEHATRADLHARFLREARVQGQLQHPAIVPVYDIDRRADGTLYFTMKLVQGETLEAVLRALRDGDPAVEARYSRRRLLSAFSTVCLAVHYAHTRGVIHRDLKPANVMLGEFGEVYVLDWGVARVGGADGADAEDDAAASAATPVALGAAAAAGQTAEGAILGTPGYMPPEQLRGQTRSLDARADVYALGAILFEILALEPLHPQRSVAEVVAATLLGGDHRPAARAPERDVPPELDALCVKATALEPADRTASARELADAIERFLDGDRDAARRRELAAEHSRAASEAAARALAGGAGAEAERKRAMAEVGRALAFDPAHRDARTTLVRLLTDAPREAPAETHAELAAERRREQRIVHASGAIVSATFWLMAPLMVWMGLRSTWMFALVAVAFTLTVVYGAYRTVRPTSDPSFPLASIVVGFLQCGLLSLLVGPFLIVPCAIATSAMGALLSDDPRNTRRMLAVALTTLVAPLALEWLGVLPPSYAFRDGAIVILPRMATFRPEPTLLLVAITSVFQVLGSTLMVASFRRALVDARERLHVNAWQLRQLLPDAASPAPRAEAVRAAPRG